MEDTQIPPMISTLTLKVINNNNNNTPSTTPRIIIKPPATPKITINSVPAAVRSLSIVKSSNPRTLPPPVRSLNLLPPPAPRSLNVLPRISNIVKLPQIQIDKDKDNEIDILMKATIYLDCTKPKDRGYNYVAERMRSISKVTKELRASYKNQLKTLPEISGIVDQASFDYLLNIYENNQVYYQDCLDEGTLTLEQVKENLTFLEYWFMCIIEPKPQDPEELIDWKQRESGKITAGHSGYCDPELYPLIAPPPKALIEYIQKFKI